MKKLFSLTLSALLGLAAIAQNYPFPMNENGYKYPYGLTASNPDNARIQTLFTKWEQAMWDEKGNLGRIKYDPEHDANNDGIKDGDQYTVSEGIGYGMLVYVYMANATNTQCQDHFDKLWRYYKKWDDGRGLMHWKIQGFNSVNGENAAPDGDLDVAYALCMAAKQWGNDGAINYAKEAETLLKNIYNHETTTHNGLRVIKPGDTWDNCGNPCYFTLSSIGMFSQAQDEWEFSTKKDWTKVYDDGHTYLERSQRNGLWPNWSAWSSSAEPTKRPWGDNSDYDFGWDACRTPWRVAQDYLWFGNTSSKGMIDKTIAFMKAKNALNNPSGLGYFSNITASSASAVSAGESYTFGNACWEGAFTTALMCDASQQSNFDRYYNSLKNISASPYYAQTLQVLYLLVASGNAANFYDCDNSSPVVVNPVISSASTDGKTITLTTSKAMNASTNYSGFTVYLDGVAQSNAISSMSVSKNTITLNLKSSVTIKSSNTVAISYSGEYLQSEQGGTLGTVTKMVVKNTVSGGNTLLADCEDGNTTLLGGTWYSYKGSGTVTDEKKLIVSGGANSTAHAAHFTYSNVSDYAGMGFNVQPEDAPYDFSGSKGISFYHKGNAATLEVGTVTTSDYSHFKYDVPYHNDWTLVTVSWTDLQSPGWGNANSANFAEDNLCSEIINIQWKTSGSGNFWIDEVTLLGREIIVPADKKALESAIATANTLHNSATTEKYPQTAIDALYAAIDAASSVNINPKASQTEVDAATTTLKNAINTFKDSEIVPVVDKSELADLIDRANNVLNTTVAGTAAGQYSATLRTKLTTALASSKTTNNNAKATQTEVNTAVANLKTAYNNYMASKVTETETTAVEDVALALSAYPNPCVDVLNIESSEEISSVAIVSMNGTRKTFEIGSETAQVSVARMQTGAYVAQVTFANGTTKTVRFVKR